MGADLFGSFAESTCAAMVIAAHSTDLRSAGWAAICYPLLLSASGIFVCFLTSFVATHLAPVRRERDIEVTLRTQLLISTLVMLPVTLAVAYTVFPASFELEGMVRSRPSNYLSTWTCSAVGSIGGLFIGLFTEYFTSHSYQPVRDVAHSSTTGAGTNIIYGLALGYRSVVAPVFILAIVLYLSFHYGDLYGLALAAVGMLSNLSIGLTIDAFGPVCDNAGGIAEMAKLPPAVREKTDALDAAGNTTAAIGKGFAIGSAALVSLALFGAFVTRVRASQLRAGGGYSMRVNILEPLTFAFMLVGAMIPYWFSSMTSTYALLLFPK